LLLLLLLNDGRSKGQVMWQTMERREKDT
jgi:hypothetical protein